MAALHETMYGKRLLEYDIPEIHRQLKRIADTLEKSQSGAIRKALEYGFERGKEGDFTTEQEQDFLASLNKFL